MKYLVYIIISISVLSSCTEDDNPMAGAPGSVAYLDIETTEYLAVQKDGDYGNGNLHKLKLTNGSFQYEKVRFADANKEPIDSIFTWIYVEEMTKVSPEYLCLYGSFHVNLDSMEIVFQSLLVNTETGKIYDFNGHFPREESFYMGSKYVQDDSESNLYYANDYGDNGIYKLSGLSGDEIVQETYVPQSQYEWGGGFYISPQANCFYNLEFRDTKIKTPSFGIIPLDQEFANFFSFKGKIFTVKVGPLVDQKIITELIVDNDEYILDTQNSINCSFGDFFYFHEDANQGFLLGNGIYDSSNGLIGAMLNEDVTEATRLSVPESLWGTQLWVEHFDEGIVLLGTEGTLNKKFYRLDLVDFSIQSMNVTDDNGDDIVADVAVLDSYDLIEFSTNIEVYDYEFISTGEISFNGFDLSSEEDISGVIDQEGNVNVLERSKNFSYSILERIN